MHAFMATVLLRMAGLDTLDGKAEPKPPNGEPTQVERKLEGLAVTSRTFPPSSSASSV
jgi:hypothetical protein